MRHPLPPPMKPLIKPIHEDDAAFTLLHAAPHAAGGGEGFGAAVYGFEGGGEVGGAFGPGGDETYGGVL
ncbi:hypothetical protein V491_02927 [Pseudogymnoascus sp. VKM F-3775]|nr:hypothetical protein V491_02927 [Pseudogymnoascus sp. VKM F-3775]